MAYDNNDYPEQPEDKYAPWVVTTLVLVVCGVFWYAVYTTGKYFNWW